MEIIRFADLRSEPWRNGGGVTRELASHPQAASAQDGAWDWRVSIADVTKAGDFSAVPGHGARADRDRRASSSC